MSVQSQSLTTERPQRLVGTLIGAGAAAIALVLAAALYNKVSGWPISFPQFLGYGGACALVLLAVVFAFWAYGCLSMRYMLDGSGLTIIWGPIKHFVAFNRIVKLTHGRGEHRPRIGGLGWPRYHVGRGHVADFGRVLFFSTHNTPEQLVYVQTAGATYALSPQNPDRFIAAAERFQKAKAEVTLPAVQRHLIAAHPIWVDRVAQALVVLAIIANVALWGMIFAAYPDLNAEITIKFPPIGEIAALHQRHEILQIPLTATAILGANLLAALAFQWRERAAALLILSAGVLFQASFWIAAIVALRNA